MKYHVLAVGLKGDLLSHCRVFFAKKDTELKSVLISRKGTIAIHIPLKIKIHIVKPPGERLDPSLQKRLRIACLLSAAFFCFDSFFCLSLSVYEEWWQKLSEIILGFSG